MTKLRDLESEIKDKDFKAAMDAIVIKGGADERSEIRNGTCSMNTTCSDNSSCHDNEHCYIDGICEINKWCSNDSTCHNNEECHGNTECVGSYKKPEVVNGCECHHSNSKCPSVNEQCQQTTDSDGDL